MRRVLTSIEKLDGFHPGLGTNVRIWLDEGKTAEEIQKRLRDQFGASVGKDAINYHRRNRWAPLKDRVVDEVVTVKAIMDFVGGDAGIDMFMSARLLQDLHELKEASLIDAKELFIKIRAQNLKEEEFKFKSGQLKPGGAGEAEDDPAAQEAKRKRVMNKIRAIFGLSPLPEDMDEEESEPDSQETAGNDEQSASEPETGPLAGSGQDSEGTGQQLQADIEPPAEREIEPLENASSGGDADSEITESAE